MAREGLCNDIWHIFSIFYTVKLFKRIRIWKIVRRNSSDGAVIFALNDLQNVENQQGKQRNQQINVLLLVWCFTRDDLEYCKGNLGIIPMVATKIKTCLKMLFEKY